MTEMTEMTENEFNSAEGTVFITDGAGGFKEVPKTNKEKYSTGKFYKKQQQAPGLTSPEAGGSDTSTIPQEDAGGLAKNVTPTLPPATISENNVTAAVELAEKVIERLKLTGPDAATAPATAPVTGGRRRTKRKHHKKGKSSKKGGKKHRKSSGKKSRRHGRK